MNKLCFQLALETMSIVIYQLNLNDLSSGARDLQTLRRAFFRTTTLDTLRFPESTIKRHHILKATIMWLYNNIH